jgi:hypothetical protein
MIMWRFMAGRPLGRMPAALARKFWPWAWPGGTCPESGKRIPIRIIVGCDTAMYRILLFYAVQEDLYKISKKFDLTQELYLGKESLEYTISCARIDKVLLFSPHRILCRPQSHKLSSCQMPDCILKSIG